VEKRKVQKFGPSSLCVSLPKAWTQSLNVKPGDAVYIVQETDALRITTRVDSDEHEVKTYTINCDYIESPNQLERLIVAIYMMGVDTITISSAQRIPSQTLEVIRTIVHKLVGANLTESTEQDVVIDHFIAPSQLNVLTLLQKQSTITSTMLHESLEGLLSLNTTFADDCIKREHEADSLYFLITRLVFNLQQKQSSPMKSETRLSPASIRLITKNLERIADCAEYIAKVTLNLDNIRDEINIQELKKMTTLYHTVKRLYKMATDSLFSGNITTANNAADLRRKIDTELWSQLPEIRIP